MYLYTHYVVGHARRGLILASTVRNYEEANKNIKNLWAERWNDSRRKKVKQ